MRRWFVWLPLVLLGLLAAVLAAAVFARAHLVQTAAKAWLTRQGFPEAELQVTTLTFRQLELSGLSLGPETSAPNAARITIDYDPHDLLDGRVQRVEVVGLNLTVDMTRDRPLGRLTDLIPGPKAASPSAGGTPDLTLPPDLPAVTLRNAAVTVIDPRGTVEISLDGRIAPEGEETRALLRGQARTHHTTVDLVASANDLRTQPRLRFEVTGKSDLAHLPWPVDTPLRPTAGHATFALDGEARLPESGTPLTVAALVERTGHLSLSLRVAGADFEGENTMLARGVSAETQIHAEVGDGALLLRLPAPLTLTAEDLPRQTPETLGAPRELADLVADARRLTVSPWTGGGELMSVSRDDDGWTWTGQASAQLDLVEGGLRVAASGGGALSPDFGFRHAAAERLDVESWDISYGPHTLASGTFSGTAEAKPGGLTADGTLKAKGLSLVTEGQALRGLSLEMPLALRHTDAGTRLTLPAPGRVSVPQLPATGPVALDLPLDVSVQSLEATRLTDGLQARVRFDPGKLHATLVRQNAPDLAVNAVPGPVVLSTTAGDKFMATASLSEAQLNAPDMQARASDISADLAYGGNAPLARITVGRLEHLGNPAYAAPARLETTIERGGDGVLRANGEVQPLKSDFVVPLTAEHDPTRGRGGLDIGPATADFAPEELQPATLSPLIAPHITRAEGKVTVEGHIAWTPEGLTSTGQADVSALTLVTPQATVENLSGTLEFDRLIPPTTTPSQSLTADRVTAGVPLTNVTLRFGLDWPGDGPVIALERIEGGLAGGTLFLENERLRPLAERNALTMRVKDLSLAELVAELDVEGFSAEGTLDGQMPLALGPEGFSVDQGSLAAIRTGAIKLDLGGTSDALASRGEQVELMVRALRNFQYDELSLRVNRPPGGDLELAITMQGKNPEVLDGYPFRFNINLTGDLEPILAALQEGRRLTTELLDRALETQ